MIKEGSKVKFDYTLTVDGKVADTSAGRGPLEYTHGAGHIIPGLEEELLGMKVGDKKTVKVAPEKGYGKVLEEAIRRVPKEAIGGAENLKVGDMGATPSARSSRKLRTKKWCWISTTRSPEKNLPLTWKLKRLTKFYRHKKHQV